MAHDGSSSGEGWTPLLPSGRAPEPPEPPVLILNGSEDAEYQESVSARGVALRWTAEDWEFLGEDVVPKDGTIRRSHYYPATCRELPYEFARVAHGDDAELRAFVNRRGRLGYKEMCEAWDYENLRDTESASWIRAHARNVDLVMRLAEASGNLPKAFLILRERFRESVEREKDEPDSTWITFRYARGPISESIGIASWEEAPAQIGDSVIAVILDENLARVRRRHALELSQYRSRPGSEARTLSVFTISSLLECIYWLLADQINGAHLRKCEACQRVFFAGHASRRFCPPVGQPIDNGTRSPCEVKEKRRRYAKKRRGKTLEK